MDLQSVSYPNGKLAPNPDRTSSLSLTLRLARALTPTLALARTLARTLALALTRARGPSRSASPNLHPNPTQASSPSPSGSTPSPSRTTSCCATSPRCRRSSPTRCASGSSCCSGRRRRRQFHYIFIQHGHSARRAPLYCQHARVIRGGEVTPGVSFFVPRATAVDRRSTPSLGIIPGPTDYKNISPGLPSSSVSSK
jgi:hypothetical protein